MTRLLAFLRRFRYLLLFLLLVGLALALLAYPEHRNRASRFLRTTLLELAGPFQKGVSTAVLFVQQSAEKYVLSIHAQEQNRILRQIIEELKQERLQLLEARAENLRLRTLLGFKQNFPAPLLPAQVVGKDANAWFHTLVIDRGKSDGVDEGMAVLSAQGIVGQVMESSTSFSRVLLITDPNSAVAALVQRTRARGIAEGSGLDKCRLKYLHQSDDVVEGDTVLSSGLDGVYPEGSLIGVVTRAQKSEGEIFQDVMLQPSVDFNKLEEVLVLCRKPAVMPPVKEDK